MTGKKITPFQKIANAKGWKFEDIAQRWGLSERQLSRIADSPKLRDFDALFGLPDYKKKDKMMSKTFSNETLNEIENYTFNKLKTDLGLCSTGAISDVGAANKTGVILVSRDSEGNDILVTIELRSKSK